MGSISGASDTDPGPTLHRARAGPPLHLKVRLRARRLVDARTVLVGPEESPQVSVCLMLVLHLSDTLFSG